MTQAEPLAPGVWVAEDVAEGVGGFKLLGNNLSMSALPNSHPAGRASSLHKVNRMLLSQTSEVYNLDKPLRTDNPRSEPQLLTEMFLISFCPVRLTVTNMLM